MRQNGAGEGEKENMNEWIKHGPSSEAVIALSMAMWLCREKLFIYCINILSGPLLICIYTVSLPFGMRRKEHCREHILVRLLRWLLLDDVAKCSDNTKYLIVAGAVNLCHWSMIDCSFGSKANAFSHSLNPKVLDHIFLLLFQVGRPCTVIKYNFIFVYFCFLG